MLTEETVTVTKKLETKFQIGFWVVAKITDSTECSLYLMMFPKRCEKLKLEEKVTRT